MLFTSPPFKGYLRYEEMRIQHLIEYKEGEVDALAPLDRTYINETPQGFLRLKNILRISYSKRETYKTRKQTETSLSIYPRINKEFDSSGERNQNIAGARTLRTNKFASAYRLYPFIGYKEIVYFV
jgi:hypothetical protein